MPEGPDEGNREKANYMTVPAAIKELSKIEMVKQTDGIYRLSYAVTATQKEILQAFNLTAADVKKQSIELAGYLRTLTAYGIPSRQRLLPYGR